MAFEDIASNFRGNIKTGVCSEEGKEACKMLNYSVPQFHQVKVRRAQYIYIFFFYIRSQETEHVLQVGMNISSQSGENINLTSNVSCNYLYEVRASSLCIWQRVVWSWCLGLNITSE